MAKLPLVIHIFSAANIALLLVGVFLVREFWRPIGSVLTRMAGMRLPWMPGIFVLTLLFFGLGLLLVAADIRKMAGGQPLAVHKLEIGGLVAVLLFWNAFVISIVARVSVEGTVPVTTQLCRLLMRPKTDYVLPELLRFSDGAQVADAAAWTKKRRPEILALFEEEIYGRIPARKLTAEVTLKSTDRNALNGKAVRKEVVLSFKNGERDLDLNMLIYLPAKSNGPVPAFVGLNFYGNHTVHSDPGITIRKWSESEQTLSELDERRIADTRGSRATHWPVERILQRGYALVTMCYHDVDPDFDDGFQNGVHPLFYEQGQSRPAPDEWGSISAWAWGLSRIMDYVEGDADIDETRVAVMGHSRLGKTALWAGAQDERFAVVISNNSGCMGAALSRRKYGETIAAITLRYPHWFCGNFRKYAGREDELPVDQHMLIALIAPRPVYIASAQLDLWADPEGEFLSALAASDVYRLLGKEGLAAGKLPNLHQPLMSTIGYHIRKGKHWVTPYDWECFLDFTDRHLSKYIFPQ